MESQKEAIYRLRKKRVYPYHVLCKPLESSSFFFSVSYIRKSKILILEGTENYYLYTQVPVHKYYYLLKCRNKGRYFNRNIKTIAKKCIVLNKNIHSGDLTLN